MFAAYHRAVAAISALASSAQSSKPTEFFVEACVAKSFRFAMQTYLMLVGTGTKAMPIPMLDRRWAPRSDSF